MCFLEVNNGYIGYYYGVLDVQVLVSSFNLSHHPKMGRVGSPGNPCRFLESQGCVDCFGVTILV